MKLACPNCGANISYVLGTNEVVCEHCGQRTSVSNVKINDYINYSKSLKKDLKKVDSKAITISEIMKDSSKCTVNSKLLMCKKCHSSFFEFYNQSTKFCPYCKSNWNKNGINGVFGDLVITKYVPFSRTFNPKDAFHQINRYDDFHIPIENFCKTYLPFLASCDKVEYDSSRVNLKEEMLTLQYIGKSFNYDEIQSVINFNLSKLEKFSESKIVDNVVIDAPNEDISTLTKRHRENVNKGLKKQICIQLKDPNYQISVNKDSILCSSIKSEIILLPFYVLRENDITYIINGQNWEKNKIGKEVFDTTAERIMKGVMLSPFILPLLLIPINLLVSFLYLIYSIFTLNLKLVLQEFFCVTIFGAITYGLRFLYLDLIKDKRQSLC